MSNLSADQWATRYDRQTEYINDEVGARMEEELWARRLGFESAQAYHDASREAFEESVRDEEYMEAYE